MKRSTFQKNILAGMGNILTIWPAQYPQPASQQTDMDRLRSDWVQVGNDLKRAVSKVADELQKKPASR